ncbi:MAG: hypothetical protein IPL08_10400 [Saprospiraceae bacterium]|nr:hypothetical protein [Saprospiraceae bacterium]
MMLGTNEALYHWMDDKKGNMPMPLDITVKDKNGKMHYYYIPQEIMRGEKKGDRFFGDFKVMSDWAWTHPHISWI